MIKAFHLTKIYQAGEVEVHALNDVSFEVDKGEFVAIMGPSGSGKSTLMHILGALDVPTSGEYWLDGEKIANLNDDQLAEVRNKKIGFIFQSYNLLPRTSAFKNVLIPMLYGDVPAAKREARALILLKQMGLGDRLDHTSSQLSGGQQQRVAIARALSMEPSILLADEPTGNIATQQAEEIMQIFENLNEAGHTILMITHEEEIAEYAKRVILIRDGRLVDDRPNGHRRRVKKG